MATLSSLISHRLTIFAAGLGMGGVVGWLVAEAFRGTPAPVVVAAPGKVVLPPVSPQEEMARAGVLSVREAPPEVAAPDSPAPQEVLRAPVVLKPATTVEEASSQMEGILRLESEEERVEQWVKMLAMITPRNFAVYHEAWKLGVSRRGSPQPQDTLYNRRAGEVAGAEVVGMRDGYGVKDMYGATTYVKDQFEGWIRVDPAAAERWLEGLQHPTFRAAMEEVWEGVAVESEKRVRGGK